METIEKLRQISVFWSKFHKNFSNESAISVTKYWNSVILGSPANQIKISSHPRACELTHRHVLCCWKGNIHTWTPRSLKSPAISLLSNSLLRLTTKKISKLRSTRPLRGESAVRVMDSLTRDQQCRKRFHVTILQRKCCHLAEIHQCQHRKLSFWQLYGAANDVHFKMIFPF